MTIRSRTTLEKGKEYTYGEESDKTYKQAIEK